MKKETIEKLFDELNKMESDFMGRQIEINSTRKMIDIVLSTEFEKTLEYFWDNDQQIYIFKEV